MAVSQADLAIPILQALQGNSAITSMLPTYMGKPTIFTRRPVPPNAPYPMIVVSADISRNNNMDGLSDQRPVVTRDLIVYGSNDTDTNYRTVELIAYAVFDQFHRNHTSITPPDTWIIWDIVGLGPTPAPVDDDQHVARVVPLEVYLAHPS
jgi:hypothetical protein